MSFNAINILKLKIIKIMQSSENMLVYLGITAEIMMIRQQLSKLAIYIYANVNSMY